MLRGQTIKLVGNVGRINGPMVRRGLDVRTEVRRLTVELVDVDVELTVASDDPDRVSGMVRIHGNATLELVSDEVIVY